MDPWDHPDLVDIDRLLSSRLEETLQAEQYAARLAFRRRQSLRDRLLEIEDQAGWVELQAVNGTTYAGRVVAVGVDHICVQSGGAQQIVALHHIVAASTDWDS